MTVKLPPIKELTYEQAFTELEDLVAAFESEERNLEDALTQISGEILIPFDAE